MQLLKEDARESFIHERELVLANLKLVSKEIQGKVKSAEDYYQSLSEYALRHEKARREGWIAHQLA